MKYDAYINNNKLVLEPKRGKPVVIPLVDISEFTIDKTIAGTNVVSSVNGTTYILPLTYKHPKGNIVIGLKNGVKKEVYRHNYKKVVTCYDYIKIKGITDVYGLCEKVIDLGVHYDKVIFKEIKKYDYDGNEVYNCSKFFYNKV
ncbi:MAG: hypothetical protein J6W25_02415 [Bacilli bacterium]|nr:hypothetical protein [Bacilli bacterium]